MCRRSVCYIHHNITKSGIVCVDADDFSLGRTLHTPTLFPDIKCECVSTTVERVYSQFALLACFLTIIRFDYLVHIILFDLY